MILTRYYQPKKVAVSVEAHCDNCGRIMRKFKWIWHDHTACTKKCLADLVSMDCEEFAQDYSSL